jgi:hypothetical protein
MSSDVRVTGEVMAIPGKGLTRQPHGAVSAGYANARQ